MIFIDFKNYLIKNNILLFDDQYRIIYKNAIDLLQKTNNCKNEINYISPFYIIKNDDQEKIKLLIYSLLSNNMKASLYICKSDLKLSYFL